MPSSWRSGLLLAALLTLAVPTEAAILELTAPAPAAFRSGGFELSNPARVRVEAQGLELDPEAARDGGWRIGWGDSWIRFDDGGEERLACYAWILDAGSREPVWVMDLEETDPGDDRGLRLERVELELPAGRYEVYVYGGHERLVSVDEDGWGRRSVRRRIEEIEEKLAACYVRVDAVDGAGDARTFEPDGRLDDALIAFTGVGDGAVLRQGFEMEREMRLRLYGMMEFPRNDDEPADFGWILDADTGERVWDMSDRRGRRAGGASKNRVLDRELRLGPGRYQLVYGTDDSHSAERFNAPPPYDPLAWGVQLLPGEGFEPGAFSLFEVADRGEPVIDFSRARDDEFFEQAFRLERPARVQIYAIGEGVDDGWTWVDYGWIIDARTRETVWEMDDRNTHPAGGAEKNRVFDGTLSLPAGDYVAFYITDDSHAWEDWNAGAPFDPDAWGLQLYDPEGAVRLLDADQIRRGEGVLVSMTRVRDDERLRERFTLDAETELEIHCVGEGLGGEMYDYGWIRDLDSRRVVWEMEYDDTDHAGGASKNREVYARVTLPAGEYEAVYETDGSHSFGDWNDSRPNDPLSWGLTVRRAR